MIDTWMGRTMGIAFDNDTKTAVFWKNTIYRKVQNLYNATFDFAAMLTLLIG